MLNSDGCGTVSYTAKPSQPSVSVEALGNLIETWRGREKFNGNSDGLRLGFKRCANELQKLIAAHDSSK